MENWDNNKRKNVEQTKELKAFLQEIDEVCKKHNLSIGHEDGHGSFEICEYRKENIEWLSYANLSINK